jgi:hypothetical protein
LTYFKKKYFFYFLCKGFLIKKQMDFLDDMLPPKDLGAQIVSSRIRLWLLSVQALSKLPASTSPKSAPRTGSEEEGTFMVLTCKTSLGNTVTVVVTDWLPWFRVLSNTDKDVYERLKKTTLLKSGPIQSIHREIKNGKPIEWHCRIIVSI